MTVVVLAIVGFCAADVKLFGPVHVQVVPPLFVAVKLNVCPTHKGELALTVGADGVVTEPTTTVFMIAGQLNAVSFINTV